MPRRSTASITTLNVSGAPPKLRPSARLSEREQDIFRTIVAACDARHFTPAEAPLLDRYVEAVAMAEDAADHLRAEGAVVMDKASPWVAIQEKAGRAVAAFAPKLRLSPQSRYDASLAGRRAAGTPSSPYEADDG
jgi:phage terminase small subunit